MNPQIVADESVDFRIVVQLREKGIQVYSVIEELQSAKDEAVLKIAHENNSLLLTEDKDFGELVFRLRMPHSGILLIKIADSQFKISSVTDAVIKNYKDLIGKFSVIDGHKLRIKE